MKLNICGCGLFILQLCNITSQGCGMAKKPLAFLILIRFLEYKERLVSERLYIATIKSVRQGQPHSGDAPQH